MSDYDLYYWPIPFRGQFVRAVLAHAGKTWTEADAGTVSQIMEKAAKDQPIPFMGPPMLVDHKTDFAIAEMPAVILYLGETLDLLPDTPALRALTMKIVNDANDVIDEITNDGGREMWTDKSWKAFIPRLERWMSFWEEIGRRHGLKPDAGLLLGEAETGVADIVTATLWSTMMDRFPALEAMIDKTAPMTAALTRRVMAEPAMSRLAAATRERYGDAYCGGQIEASLRKVLKA
jgi:glutathione S-transferase